jgi:hypothetical protein
MSRFLLLVGMILVFGSCSDRKKDNPFDPQGVQPINISITGFADRVSLSWNSPNVDGYSGFILYRSENVAQDSFIIYQNNIPPDQRAFDDEQVEIGTRYYYYMTIYGEGVESRPSEIVSTVPGRGFNWVLDRSGFEILKFTYDFQTLLIRHLANIRPQDMAVSDKSNRGLILYPAFGEIQVINLESGEIEDVIETISHPYAIEYDGIDESFWVIDSSGYLYNIDEQDLNVQQVSAQFRKPLYITLAVNNGYIYITDYSEKKIYQLNRSGSVINTISDINGIPLSSPEKFLYDEIYNRYWLLENTGTITYIYTKKATDSQYSKHEITARISDIELSIIDDFVYLAKLDADNSSLLQLYPNGTRQIALTGFFNPFDIAINRYDNSVIISDTGNGIVWHFDTDLLLIGRFTNLYLPSKVVVE